MEKIDNFLNRFKEWLQENENKGGRRNIVNHRKESVIERSLEGGL